MSHEFTITGEKTVSVSWRDGSHFRDGIVAHARVGGDHIDLNKARKHYVSNDVLLHELGHCLGFEHDRDGDTTYGSVMDYDMPDRDRDASLDATTVEIAAAFDGFRVIDWSLRDTLYLIAEFNAGRLDGAHVRWALAQFNGDGDSRVVYYADDWDDFGGYYTDTQFETVGPNAGHFYGIPVERGRPSLADGVPCECADD